MLALHRILRFAKPSLSLQAGYDSCIMSHELLVCQDELCLRRSDIITSTLGLNSSEWLSCSRLCTSTLISSPLLSEAVCWPLTLTCATADKSSFAVELPNAWDAEARDKSAAAARDVHPEKAMICRLRCPQSAAFCLQS